MSWCSALLRTTRRSLPLQIIDSADATFVAHRLLRAGPARTDWRGKPQDHVQRAGDHAAIVLPTIVATHNMLPMHQMMQMQR
jgi:hypothetical protein